MYGVCAGVWFIDKILLILWVDPLPDADGLPPRPTQKTWPSPLFPNRFFRMTFGCRTRKGWPSQARISTNDSVVLAHCSSGLSGSLSLQRSGIWCLLWNVRLTQNLTPASCKFLNSQRVRFRIIEAWTGPLFVIIRSNVDGGSAMLRSVWRQKRLWVTLWYAQFFWLSKFSSKTILKKRKEYFRIVSFICQSLFRLWKSKSSRRKKNKEEIFIT